MEHLNAREGVKKIYTAEILAILAVIVGVLGFIPLIGFVFALGATVLSIVAIFITLGGTKLAGNDEAGYNNAHLFLLLTIAAAVLGAILGIFFDSASTILGTVGNICELVAVYYIITSTNTLHRANGNNEMAEKGSKTWNLYCIAIILSGLASVLSIFVPIVIAILKIVAAVLEIVAYFKYLSFLNRSHPIL